MAFRWASLVALLCMTISVSAEEEPQFRLAELSAAVGGVVGGLMLIIGVMFVIYDFTCRNYFSGRAGEYFRADQEVAAGSSTKL
jgi:hypothetical protein